MLKTHRITQGDHAEFKVPLLLDGVAAPIAGWSLVMTVKESPEDPDPGVFQATAGDGAVVEHDANAWRVKLSAAASKTLGPGRYYFDYQATDPLGQPHTLERGILIVDPEITQL